MVKKGLEYWLNAEFVEPKIRRLVAYFNQVPFLKTILSCEGHFNKERFDFAEVVCEIEDSYDFLEGEKKLENMLAEIIPKIANNWSTFLGHFRKKYIAVKENKIFCPANFYVRYWDLPEPENDGLKKYYIYSIEPFMWHNKNFKECRIITDIAINLTEAIMEEYLKEKGWL